MLRAEHRPERLAGRATLRRLATDAERPVDDLPLRAGLVVELREHRRVHLLEHARHAREQRRLDRLQRLARAQRIGEEREREPDVRALQVHQPPEVVRERQVEEHRVVGHREVVDLVDDGGHRVVVAVQDHAGLRRAGRPRRVDVGEDVVGAHGRDDALELARMRKRVVPPARTQVVEVVERQDVLEPRVPRAVVVELRELLRVLDEHADRLRVVEDVLAVLGGAVRVDRGADGADVGEREVEERPLEARLPEDPEGVALPDAERQEPVGELLDGGRGLGPGDRLPALAALDEVRRAAPPRRDRVLPEPRNRARLGALRLGQRVGGDLGCHSG